MKVTIALNSQELKGIKAYLKETDEVNKPTKKHIQQYIQGIVDCTLQSPHEAVSDYIKQA